MIVQKTGFDYETYVEQQGKKANNPAKRMSLLSATSTDKRARKFQGIFRDAETDLKPGKILCLGARTGCEVVAARNCGFNDSMGIDLHPIGDIVVQGDWHDIPFKSGSFDNAFTNSIDHCYDVEKLAREVFRILNPGGMFYFMLSEKQMLSSKKDKDDYMLHSQNFLFWEDGHDLALEFEKYGFGIVKEWKYRNRWLSYLLRKEVNKSR